MAKGARGISKSIATSARRRGWVAWVASLTVLLVAWGPLLGTLHQTLVRHVVCEHGDLIETEERGQHDPSATAARESSEGSSTSVETGSGPSAHDHTHCSLG